VSSSIRENFFWDYLNKFGSTIIAFGITAVLSRVLSPADYGLIGISMAVTGIAALLLDFGFATAIVQHKDIDNYKLSTIFYFNLAIGILIWIVINLFASAIGAFYHSNEIRFILHATSFSFLISAASIVPNGLLTKQLEFKKMAILSLFSSFISGIIGILMATNGFGYWSLVAQQLSASLFVLIANFAASKWKPILYFKYSTAKPLIQFSSYIFFSSLLNGVFTRLDAFIFGKVFAPTTLGLYTRAQGLDTMIRNLSSSSLLTVLFPSFSKLQDNNGVLRDIFFRYFEIICFLFCLLGGAFYFASEPLFTGLFGEQWFVSAEYFKLLILGGYAYPVSALALSIIEAKGNSRAFFIAEVYKKIIFLPIFFVAYFYGVIPFLYCYLIAVFLGTVVNLYFLSMEIEIRLFSIVAMLAKYLLAMSIPILVCNSIFDRPGMPKGLILSLIEVPCYLTFFLLMNLLLRNKGLSFTFKLIIKNL
jgi:teichuronic acid exporter